jgi:heme/copper-type cytochrome/quinol oxidase subunit 2
MTLETINNSFMVKVVINILVAIALGTCLWFIKVNTNPIKDGIEKMESILVVYPFIVPLIIVALCGKIGVDYFHKQSQSNLYMGECAFMKSDPVKFNSCMQQLVNRKRREAESRQRQAS